MNTLKLCVLLFFVFMSLDAHLMQKPNPKRLVAKMIYYNSIHSPFFNPNSTMKDRLHDEMKISLQRLAYLKISTRANFSSEKFLSKIVPGGHPPLFFVYFYVGSPAIQQLLGIDTGSNLIWIQCKPCESPCGGNESVQVPLYDPQKSKPYDVPCDSFYCINSGAKENSCSLSGECNYKVEYGTGMSNGTLIRDRFATTECELLEDIVFGCSKYACINGTQTLTKTNGILGLGRGEISLVSQSGFDKFSYCIDGLFDYVSDRNKLIVGEPLINNNYSTPLIIYNNHYYVNLIGISVGDKLLDVNPYILRRNSVRQTGGALIDTGSTLSFLPLVAYIKLRDEVLRLLDGVERSPVFTGRKNKLEICFVGSVKITLRDFPLVTYHFEEGATLKLNRWQLFQRYGSDDFCLDVEFGEAHGWSSSLIGVRLQQFSYVAYDLHNMRVSFQSVDCSHI